MAFVHGRNTKVYVNGFDLSDMFKSASIPASAGVAKTTTFGAADETYIAGLRDSTLSLEGLFDGAVDKVDAVLAPILGADAKSFWTILQDGDTFGNRGVGIKGIETSYEVTSPLDDVVSVTAEAQSASGRDGIISHHALAARTADFTGSGVDGVAASADGGVGYLHVTAYSGFTSVIVKIQDSADNVAFADILTFATLTAARVAERKAITGTVRRFTRVFIDVTGTGSVTLFAGFGRK